MRFWGKVVSGIMLVMAAVLAVVAMVVPEARWASGVAAAVVSVVALFGVPAIVRFFSSFTRDEEVLANGFVGSAIIVSLKPTGWHYNRYYPIVKFDLSVEARGAVYPVEVTQAVDPELLQRLSPGDVVAVRVDREKRTKVVIDWREPVHATDARKGESADKRPTETAPVSDRSAMSSLWPFLRWAFLVFGLVFLRLGCGEGDYEKGGVRVQGTVLQKTYSPGTRSTAGHPGSPPKNYVSYGFTTKEGRALEGKYDVLPGTWQKLKEGDPVTVEYLADSPTTNRIPDQRARSGTWRIMALVLLVASGILFIRVRRQRLAQSTS
jgi:hypothetical protein